MLGLENMFTAGSFQEFTNQTIGIMAMVGLIFLASKLFSRKNRMAHATSKADKKTKRYTDPNVYAKQRKYKDYTKSTLVTYWRTQQKHQKRIRQSLSKIGSATGALASKGKKLFKDMYKYTKSGVQGYMLEVEETKIDQGMNQASILPQIQPLDRVLALLQTLKTEENLQARLELQKQTIATLHEIAKEFNEVSAHVRNTTVAQYNTERAMRKVARSISRSLAKEERVAKKIMEDAHALDEKVEVKLPEPPNKSVFTQFTRQRVKKTVKKISINKRRKQFSYYIENLPKIIELLKQLEDWCEHEIASDKNFLTVQKEIERYEEYREAVHEHLDKLKEDTQVEIPPKVENTDKIPAMVEAVEHYNEQSLEQAEEHIKELIKKFEVVIEQKKETIQSIEGKA